MADQLAVGQRVWISSRAGYIRYLDTTQFADGLWVGVELDDPVGKNNGIVKDVQYFTCGANHGIFVRPAQVQIEAPPAVEKKAEKKGKAAAPSGAADAAASGAGTPAASPKRASTTPRVAALPQAAKASGAADAATSPAGTPSPATVKRSSTTSSPSVVKTTSTASRAAAAKTSGAASATASPAGSPKVRTSISSRAAVGDAAKASRTTAAESPSASPKRASTATKPQGPSAAGDAAKAAAAPAPSAPAPPAQTAPEEAEAAAAVAPSEESAQPAQAAPAEEAAVAAPSEPAEPAQTVTPEEAEALAKREAEEAAKAEAEAQAARDMQAQAQKLREAEVAAAARAAEAAEAAAAARAEDERRAAREEAVRVVRAAAAEREASAKREHEEIAAEMEGLEKEIAQLDSELPGLQERRQSVEGEAERIRAAVLEASASSAAAVEQVRRQSLIDDQAARARLQAEYSELERQRKELEKQVGEVERVASLRRSLKPKSQVSQNPTITTLRAKLEVEEKQRELLELQLEEMNIQLEELRDYLAELDDPALLAPDLQKQWHQQALETFCDNRRYETLKLRKQAADLEKVKQHLEENIVTGSNPFRVIETRIHAIEEKASELSKVAKEKEKVRDGHKELQELQLQEQQDREELEAFLRSELEQEERRERQLEAAVRKMSGERGELKERQAAQSAEVARLQIRLSTLQSGQGARPPPDQTAGAAATSETDVALAVGEWRASAARAEAWAVSLPPQLRDDAELGDSHATLCGLHRSLRKARVLSRCIHSSYVASPELTVLQAAPIQWLCKACLAGALVAYAAVGVLGRLHAASPATYAKWIRLPGFAAPAGEGALDCALDVLLRILEDAQRGGDQGRHAVVAPSARELQDTLAGLDAQRAQLMSLHGSVFKDEPFVSWQAAGHAAEAVRAVCAFVLFASADAGGGRRKQWQGLFEGADGLVKQIAEGSASGQAEGLLTVEPAAAPPEDPGPDPEGGVQEPPPHLDQTALEVLLRQVATLQAASEREPSPGEEEDAKALDRALGHADRGVAGLQAALEARGESPPPAATTDPWLHAREEVRTHLEAAERDGATLKEEVFSKLKKVEQELESTRATLLDRRHEVVQVEKAFGNARIEAEKCRLAEACLARMKTQAESSAAAAEELQKEASDQRQKVERAKKDAQGMQRSCEDLRQQIAELEKRLQKHLSTQLPPEDIVALKRTCARQQQEISALRRRQTGLREAPATVGVTERRHEEQLRSCMRKLKEAKSGLLLEHACTAVVALEEPEPERAPEMQAQRLEAFSRTAKEVGRCVGEMLREKADAGRPNSAQNGSATHDCVAVTRFLRSTAESVQRGPATRVVLPLGGGGPKPPPGLCPPVVRLPADAGDLLSVHRAIL